MNNRSEYPQYYHVEGLYGDVFAVVCREHETSYTVIQKRDVRKSFIVSKVTSHDAVKDIAAGQILGVTAHDYEEVLTKQFGFSLSNDVICYHPEPEEKAIVKDDKPSITPTGEDVQKDPIGADGGKSFERSEELSTIDGETKQDDVGSANDTGKIDKTPPPEPTNDGGSNPKPVQDPS